MMLFHGEKFRWEKIQSRCDTCGSGVPLEISKHQKMEGGGEILVT